MTRPSSSPLILADHKFLHHFQQRTSPFVPPRFHHQQQPIHAPSEDVTSTTIVDNAITQTIAISHTNAVLATGTIPTHIAQKGDSLDDNFNPLPTY